MEGQVLRKEEGEEVTSFLSQIWCLPPEQEFGVPQELDVRATSPGLDRALSF